MRIRRLASGRRTALANMLVQYGPVDNRYREVGFEKSQGPESTSELASPDTFTSSPF